MKLMKLKILSIFVLLASLALGIPELTNTEATNVDTAPERQAWRTALQLWTSDSPQFQALEIGNASDSTLSRVSPGVLAIEGTTILLNGGALGTPSSGTLTNCTGLPIGGITGLGTGVGTWLGTPSSANLASALTDETGSGSVVFSTAPTLSSATITGDLTVDSTTLFVDAATNRIGFGTASPAYPADFASNESGYSTMLANGAYHGYKDSGGTARTLIGSSGDVVGVGGSSTSAVSFTTSFEESGRFDSTGLQIATGNTIRFASNSGTWDGATIAGAQTFSGLVTGSAQTLSADNNLITRATLMELLGSDDYYIMREDWEYPSGWQADNTGTGSYGTGYQDHSYGTSFLTTGATSGSVSRLFRAYHTNLDPVNMQPWVWQDRTQIDSTSNVVARVGFSSGGTFVLGFEYDSSASANWRYYDAASATYTDTGVAAAANTWITFKLRSNGTTDGQVYWSVNGGSETLDSTAQDYNMNYYNYITNSAAAEKIMTKDFTSFIGYPTR